MIYYTEIVLYYCGLYVMLLSCLLKSKFRGSIALCLYATLQRQLHESFS